MLSLLISSHLFETQESFDSVLHCIFSCCNSDPKVVFMFGGGEGDILLDNVHCFGNETNLFECVHDEIREHNCVHSEDTGVSCGNSPLPSRLIQCLLCYDMFH